MSREFRRELDRARLLSMLPATVAVVLRSGLYLGRMGATRALRAARHEGLCLWMGRGPDRVWLRTPAGDEFVLRVMPVGGLRSMGRAEERS